MPRARNRLVALILAGVLIVGGQLLKGPPRDPDTLVGLTEIAGSFLVFLGWSVCTLSWGGFWTRKLGLEEAGLGALAPSAVLGTAWLSITGFVLGALGLIGYPWAPLHTLFFLAGPVLELVHARSSGSREVPRKREPWRWNELLLLSVVLSQLLEDLINGALANGSTDAPMYHLLAPRYWSEIGKIGFRPDWPALFYASWWEHLYLWGNSLLGGPRGLGLIETQLFGQWTHVLLGFGATLAVVFALQRMFGASRPWALAGCLAVCFSVEQRLWVAMAKNDFGIEAWTLLALGLVLSPIGDRMPVLLLSGALIGMSFSGKLVTILSLAPLFAIWAGSLLVKRKPLKQIGWFLAGGSVVTLLIFGRNFAFTGNPVFPLGDSWFPSDWMTDFARRGVAVAAGAKLKGWVGFWQTFRQGFADSPFNVAALLLIPLAFFGYGDRREAFAVGGSAFSVAAYSAWNFYNSFFRWLSASLAFLQIGGVMALELLCRRFFDAKKVVPYLAFLPAVWLCTGLRNPLAAWDALYNGVSPTVAWRTPENVNGGDARAWLRLNAKPEDLIVSLGDTGHYFNYYQRISTISYNPVFDRYLVIDRSLPSVVHVLRSYGTKYTLDIFHWTGVFFNNMGAQIDRAAWNAWDPVAYQGKDSMIVDVELLEEALAQACVLPHAAEDDFLLLMG